MVDKYPLVSVLCLSYNHANYIRKSIDSILAQKTTFDFEIVISDDASTDETTEIIKQYEAQYPKIIKPIYHKENQYSKGIDIIYPLIKKARGQFIAFCECDDYFTCDKKLQRQVDFLENHNNCVAYIHDAVKVNEDATKELGVRSPYIKEKYLNISDIIQCIACNYALNSLMVRKECIEILPDFYYTSPVGDIPLAITIALKGEFYYERSVMSAYRIASIGSWTMRTSRNKEVSKNYCEGMIKMLHEVDAFTERKYKQLIEEKIICFEFWYAQHDDPIRVFKEKRYHKHFAKLSIETKIKLIIKAFLSVLFGKKSI